MSSFYNAATQQKSKKIFLQDDNKSLSYGELATRLGKLTRLIAESQLTFGDRVVISSADHELLTLLFFGLIDSGMTPIIASPDLRASEFQLIWQTTSVQACIMDAATLERCSNDAHGFKLQLAIKKHKPKKNFMNKLLGGNKNSVEEAANFPASLNSLEALAPTVSWPEEHIAYIIMTSGSTSNPKAVPVSHGALNAHLGTLSKQFQYTSNSRILNLLPLHHADGLTQGPAVTCFSGATWVRPFAFSIQNIEPMLLSFYRYRVTHAVFVPTMLALIARLGRGLSDSFDYEEFQFIISAAGYLEQALWHDFEQTFNTQVANVYGLTETVTGAIFCGPDENTRKIGSIGKPVDCEAKVLAKDGSEPENGEVGELLLRGSNVFSGYIGREDVNKGLFRDGWLCTGDLSHVDEKGFFYIDGRIKNVVISGGENIYPEEITEVLGNFPLIFEAVCFGVEHPEWGEILVAALVVDDAYSQDELVTWCGDQLSHFKIPKEWMVVNEIPRGPSGKVLLPKIRDIFLEQKSSSSVANSKDIVASVYAIAAEIFHVATSTLEARSSPENTVGWDSLAHVNFTLALESQMNLQLTTDEIMRISDLQAACDIVSEKIG